VNPVCEKLRVQKHQPRQNTGVSAKPPWVHQWRKAVPGTEHQVHLHPNWRDSRGSKIGASIPLELIEVTIRSYSAGEDDIVRLTRSNTAERMKPLPHKRLCPWSITLQSASQPASSNITFNMGFGGIRTGYSPTVPNLTDKRSMRKFLHYGEVEQPSAMEADNGIHYPFQAAGASGSVENQPCFGDSLNPAVSTLCLSPILALPTYGWFATLGTRAKIVFHRTRPFTQTAPKKKPKG